MYDARSNVTNHFSFFIPVKLKKLHPYTPVRVRIIDRSNYCYCNYQLLYIVDVHKTYVSVK